MLSKRIIAALDIRDGKVVKGIKFQNIMEVGNPVLSAVNYEKQGVDEIVFLDITASHERRGILKDIVVEVASVLSIPFTVGGGLNNVEDMKTIIKSGADKVFINSAAVKKPALISDAAEVIGSANLCIAVDVKRMNDSWHVFINGGRIDTGLDAVEWCRRCEQLGAGEILLTSMDTDGVKEGFDIGLTGIISDAVTLPVIASGGAGKIEDFIEVFTETSASAALAASIFHYGTVSISELKNNLERNGINVRKI
ncbi:MAG TPA: imidazole glycerol phosphate synthase subunit HisF [Thermotogota bacterium]|nr:imidazole glycerol phosphate synthase subunit HisF [Thermotogota bacterium]